MTISNIPALKYFRQPFAILQREMRGGTARFGVFWACLFLGVAAVSAVGSFSASSRAGLSRNAKALLGGDLEIKISHRRLTEPQLAFLKENSQQISAIASMRAMARANDKSLLVELKGVDSLYPLYGALKLSPDLDKNSTFSPANNLFGAAVDPVLLERLGLKIGQQIQIGDAGFTIRAKIESEPDRAVQAFTLGPRVMVSMQGLNSTGLILPGSLIRYAWRARLADNRSPGQLQKELNSKWPDEGWRVRDFSKAAPRIRRILETLDTNLTLVGLAALLVGGLGISGAVRAYIQFKLKNIAVMKCVGATSNLLLLSYTAQILVLALPAVLLGLAAGAFIPLLLSWLMQASLPVPLDTGIYLLPLAKAALFGLLVTLTFSLPALGMTRNAPPSALFRGSLDFSRIKIDRLTLALTTITAVTLIIAIIMFSHDRVMAVWFLIGSAGCFVFFQAIALLVIWLSKIVPSNNSPCLRLGIANISRPGAPTRSLVFSLGMGLTALVAVTQVEGNITSLIHRDMARKAPAFFFVDVQPYQLQQFEDTLSGTKKVTKVEKSATLRGRITGIAGQDVAARKIDPAVKWAVRGDRSLTWAKTIPRGTEIEKGEWWPENYQGPPLVSLTADLAKGFGVDVGDTLSVDILGKNITARIASIRNVDWTTLALQFALIFSPGILEKSPQTWIAAVYTDPDAENSVYQAVTDKFSNITAIRIKEVLDTVSNLLARMGTVFTVMSALVLLTGILVLAGSVLADQQQRIYDAVIFKVCGATSGNTLAALAVEFLFTGLTTAIFSLFTGSLTAWAVVEKLMRSNFSFQIEAAGLTIFLGIAFALGTGLAGTLKVLKSRPGPYLRNK